MAGYVVGVDLGGTKIMTARVSPAGEVLEQHREATPAAEGVDAVVEAILRSIQAVIADADPAELIGVGVGAPGPLDPATGILYSPPNLPGWDSVPLRDILGERLAALLDRPVPVQLGNDANAAALGEYLFGVGRDRPGLRHLVYFTISTGIGSGVIADGRIFGGAHGLAVELGHTTVDLHGPRCKCGNIGCIEAIAAGPAIARQGAELVAGGKAPVLAALAGGRADAVTTELVEAAARQGDPDALDLITHAGVAIGTAVVNAIHTFNPQMIVIGGGVAKMGPMLFEPLEATVRERTMPPFLRDLQILPATLGDQVGVLGAAALALG
ncbi:MAG: ROK family protein [Chloroflexia bacterium]